MEHVVDVTPSLFIVVQVIDTDWLSRFPISINELFKDNRIAFGNVDIPLMQPASPVGGTRDGGAYFASKVGSLVHCDMVAGPSKGESNGYTAYASSHNTNT